LAALGHRAPGVYTEWLPRSRPRGLHRTDIAGFAGVARRGPVDRPVKLESWLSFEVGFGELIADAHLGYAVKGFFANGGRTCWITRALPRAGATVAASKLFRVAVDAQGPGNAFAAFRFVATTPGSWGNDISATILPTVGGIELMVELGHRALLRRRALYITDLSMTDASEIRRATDLPVVLLAGDVAATPASVGLEIRDDIRFGLDEQALEAGRGLRLKLEGGDDRLADLQADDMRRAIGHLAEIEEIGLIAAPDIMLPRPRQSDDDASSEAVGHATSSEPHFDPIQITDLQQALVEQCEVRGDRFALLDPPFAEMSPSDLKRLGLPGSAFAAFYYPWLWVPRGEIGTPVRPVPPSGHIAGLIARRDRERGVHAPPANIELEEVSEVRQELSPELHAHLNAYGVNVIRVVPGRGIRVMGARTLSGSPWDPKGWHEDHAWRYIHVRRLVSLIVETLDAEAQWTVFEAEGPVIWRAVERIAHNLLFALWQRGALAGRTQAEAFYVRCDATTNPPGLRALGRVICMIGLRPVPPAEYVLLRIAFVEGGSEATVAAGGQHG
jgi:hypothetical protein